MKRLILLSFLLLFWVGCSSVNVQHHKKANFNINDTVTVICERDDHLGLQGELVHILLSRGYDVVSKEVATKKAKLDISLDHSNNKIKGGLEEYSTTEIRSVYALSFSYSSGFDGVFSERKIKKLYGSLIDLRTGKIVKSLKIDRSIWSLKGNSAYLEALVDQMQ